MQVIEKARAKAKERRHTMKVTIQQNAELRTLLAEEKGKVVQLAQQVMHLKNIEKQYSALLTKSIQMENDIYELKEALEELSD